MGRAKAGPAPGGLLELPRYTAAGPAVLRIPALCAEFVLDVLEACPVKDPDWPATHRASLARLLEDDAVVAAIRNAAPDLAHALDTPDALARPRVALAVDRYLNRMGTRATPFGLLAGVAGATVADGPQPSRPSGLEWDGRLRPVVAPDASWSRRAPDPEGGDDLLVAAASLVHTVDGQLWLEPSGNERPRWLRRSAPVQLLLDALADGPVSLGSLHALLVRRYPSADPGDAHRLAARLLRLGFLRAVSSADRDGPSAEVVEVVDLCARFNAVPDPLALAGLETSLAEAHPPADFPLLRVDAVATLTRARVDPAVAALAEEAASVLALIGRGSRYPADLAHAAAVFSRHFGAGAHLPALETVHTLTALGALGPRARPTREPDLARETLLAGLVARALAEREIVCELDDALLARLAPAGPDARPVLPGVDVCLRAGRAPGDPDAPWQAVLCGPGAVPTGVAYGRFTHLLDAETRRALRAVVRAEEAVAPEFAFAELGYRPRYGRAANVTARDLWRPRQLAVDVPTVVRPSGVLDVADVLVGVEAGRFTLHSARLGRPLHLTQAHALALHLAPPVCRFLLDASANQFRHPAPFDWGRAALGPFLPRLARGGLVLASARWRLGGLAAPEPANTADTTDEDEDGAEFTSRVGAWARTWLVPRHVRLVEGSGHLLLDLESGVSLAQLRAAVRRAGESGVALEEALPLPGHEVLADTRGRRYAAEVVIPVLAARAVAAPTAVGPVVATVPRLHRPGDGWLSLHLSLDAALQGALITGPLRRLAEDVGPDGLFFVRYADPGDELRLRVRAGRRTADQLLAWARDVARALPVSEVALRGYRPEIDRYGGPGAIAHAERLFCADSEAVIRLLGDQPRGDRRLPLPICAALTIDRLATLLLPDPAARRELAAGLAAREAGALEHRAHGAALWSARTEPGPVLSWLDGAAELWTPAAADYRACPEVGLPEAAAVLHLHANRMGLTRAQEATAVGVWRRLLARDAHDARTAAAQPSVNPRREVAPS